MKSRMLATIATVISLLALPSAADVVVSNVTEPERDHNVIDDQLWSAQGFVTDGQAYQLTEVRAIVGNEIGLSGAFAELRSSTPSGDLDTSPAGLITRFVIPDLSGPLAVRSFIPETSLVLPADTQYYFLVGANGPGSFEWSYAQGNATTGPGALTGYYYTFDGGGLWGLHGFENPFHVEVNGETGATDILVSNLAESVRDFNTIDSLVWAAQSFATDVQTYQMTEIQAFVGGESGSSGAFAELRSSTPTGEMDTSPAGLITTFVVPDLSGPRVIRSFLPTSSVVLAPDTTYHFTLGATGPGSFEWSYAEGNGQIGLGILAAYQYSFDGGGLWGSFGSENPFHTEVRVVPEPATGAMVLVGATAMAMLRRRRVAIPGGRRQIFPRIRINPASEEATRVMLRTGIILFAALGAAAPVEAAPTFVVNSTLDLPASGNVADGICETGPGNGVCTLRAAIMEANAVVGGGAAIEVPAGVYLITRPGFDEDAGSTGDFDIATSMTISGKGPGVTILDANRVDRVLDVRASANPVTLRDLAIRRGDARFFEGGGIKSQGGLTIRNVVVSDNIYSGGVWSSGTLTVDRCIIENNLSEDPIAGGITNFAGTLEIADSIVRANVSDGFDSAGGLSNRGTTKIVRTLIDGNSGRYAAGIYQGSGSLIIQNSTLTRNAGGIALYLYSNSTPIELVSVSILNNSSTLDPSVGYGAIFRDLTESVSLRNSLIAGNLVSGVPRDCGDFGGFIPPILSGDYNLIGARSTCPLSGALTHVNVSSFSFPPFQPSAQGGFSEDLGNFGPEVDQIPAVLCVDEFGLPLEVDQRGLARDSECDIGAIEFDGAYRPAQLLGTQLIRNGGAESNEFGTTNGTSVRQPPYYFMNTPGAMTQLNYGLVGGYPLASEAPLGSGSYFFGGGNTPLSGGGQHIDVSGLASEIDAGGVAYAASGAFGGYLTNDDSATMSVGFSDAQGLGLGNVSLGGFRAVDRGNLTRLIPDSRIGTIPVGTRFIDVNLQMQRFAGSSNDGYADDISLVLPEPSSAVMTFVGFAGLVGMGSVSISRRAPLPSRPRGATSRRSRFVKSAETRHLCEISRSLHLVHSGFSSSVATARRLSWFARRAPR